MTRYCIIIAAWFSIAAVDSLTSGAAQRSSPGNDSAVGEGDGSLAPAELGTRPAGPATGRGNVEGVVRYKADPQRPWRYSRYYVKDTEDGLLAEAVVALEGVALASLAPPASKGSRLMDQVNFQFVPETMAIRAGDTVRFANNDDSIHNVMTSDGGQPFNINVVKGEEVARLFDQAGGLQHPIRLGCIFHGGMRAWIFVFDHPWFAVTQRDGRFRLENVPPGEYRVGVRHAAGRLRWERPIAVRPNERATLEIVLTPEDVGDSQ